MTSFIPSSVIAFNANETFSKHWCWLVGVRKNLREIFELGCWRWLTSLMSRTPFERSVFRSLILSFSALSCSLTQFVNVLFCIKIHLSSMLRIMVGVVVGGELLLLVVVGDGVVPFDNSCWCLDGRDDPFRHVDPVDVDCVIGEELVPFIPLLFPLLWPLLFPFVWPLLFPLLWPLLFPLLWPLLLPFVCADGIAFDRLVWFVFVLAFALVGVMKSLWWFPLSFVSKFQTK